MTDSQTGELLERATRELRPSAELVSNAVELGQRRRRRAMARAVAAGGIAAAVVVTGGLVGAAQSFDPDQRSTVADSSAGSPSSSTSGDDPAAYIAALQANPAALAGLEWTGGSIEALQADPSLVARDLKAGLTVAKLQAMGEGQPQGDYDEQLSRTGMAGELIAQLGDQGTIANPTNWLPFDIPEQPADHPKLSDGRNGHGGRVTLNGATVSVLVEATDGSGCHLGKDKCQQVDGGILGVSENQPMRSPDQRESLVVFTINGVTVTASADNYEVIYNRGAHLDEPVLDIATLTKLAEDPVFQTGPWV